jgi:hypothetical protein
MTKTLLRPLPALVAAILAPTAAQAIDFAAGGWNGSLDTTVSFGQTWRDEARDPRLIGTADGGTGRSPNIDDGDLNYRRGRVSSAYKLVSEFSLDRGENFGIFVRGAALYDTLVEDSLTARTPISERGKDLAGSYLRLLDAFAWGRWDLAGHDLDIRAGRQVVNWGESTFIQGGINNSINHFDVSALRAPGSELREAYLPQEMLKVGFGVTDNFTVEAIGIFDWNSTRPEPAGTYFSTNDFVPRGGEQVFLGFGAFSDQGTDFRPLGGPFIEGFQGVPRDETVTPSDSGQYGVSLRWFLPDFAQGTEFGFHFVNYHSKLPVISGRTGTQGGIGNAIGALTAAVATAQGLASGLPFNTAVAIAANAGAGAAANAGGDLSVATATGYATIAGNTVLGGGNLTSQATNLATHEYAQTARYFTEFPEDIRLLGVSFNTQLGTTGIALQGEVSYRMDAPLQYDDVELLFAALTPFEATLRAATGRVDPGSCTVADPTLARCGQFRGGNPDRSYGLDQVITGWGEFDVWQGQMTATKAFPPMLGASQLVAVVEAGMTHVESLPDQTSGGPNGRGLRLNGPGTSVSGNPELAGRHFGEVEPLDRFADADSWGYRAALRLDYLSLIGAWNFSPRFVWSHDVDGTTPGPGGNFVEGRTGATLGVLASYQSQLELDVSYTTFNGAGRYNELGDRDFLAATIKYSF